jgi:hypothetical protein
MQSDNFSDNSAPEKKFAGDPDREPPENFESRHGFKRIIRLARTSSPVDVPRDFTEKVMHRVAARNQPGLNDRFLQAFSKINVRRWTEVADATECALCFFLAGFFYFVLGIVLIMGLKATEVRIPLAVWIIIQPQLAFITALGFLALGIILKRKSDSAVKIAQIGTLIYIGFTVFNGIGIQRTPGNPFNSAGMLCFIGGALILGVFLLLILQKYQIKWADNRVKYNH